MQPALRHFSILFRSHSEIIALTNFFGVFQSPSHREVTYLAHVVSAYVVPVYHVERARLFISPLPYMGMQPENLWDFA